MPINKPIPACNIEATYNIITQILTLTAEGEVEKPTNDINFKMITIYSGLKFVLGSPTSLNNSGNLPYRFTESFKIQLPTNTLLSETITIITQNKPEGELVPIWFVGMFQESEILPIASETLKPKVESSAKRIPGAKNKNTRLNEPFVLKTSARVAEFAFM